MHQIGVVGLSHRHAGVDDVARFTLPKAELAARLRALRDHLGVPELVYIATCNRVEVFFATDGTQAGDARSEVFRALIGCEPQPGEATRILRARTGEAAVEHLFLVACGLDSARAGEQEIAAQLRGAWDAARAAEVSGPTLDRLVGEALGMANRIRRREAGTSAPSLAELAADRVVRHLNGEPASVALVGVSPMTRRCGMILHRAGAPLLVVNRTLQAAEELAKAVSGRAVALDRFRARPVDVSAVVLAAGGGEPVLDVAALALLGQTAGRTPLIIDFGVPPNVDPEAARAAGLERLGMNDLIRVAKEQRLSELMRLAPVRAAIDERLARLRGEFATRAIGRRLADLRGSFEQIAAQEVDCALATKLRDLDDSQRQILQRLASSMARRLAHLPIAGLRAAAAHASAEAVDAFFREARLRRPARAGRPQAHQRRP
jgi:glutamyl-tRNA reductase